MFKSVQNGEYEIYRWLCWHVISINLILNMFTHSSKPAFIHTRTNTHKHTHSVKERNWVRKKQRENINRKITKTNSLTNISFHFQQITTYWKIRKIFLKVLENDFTTFVWTLLSFVSKFFNLYMSYYGIMCHYATQFILHFVTSLLHAF